MFCAPVPADVCRDLGDKVIRAFSRAVSLTREDLSKYRATFPGWVADHCERGLAGWIHDRLWAHVLAEFQDIDEVTIVDREPLRELYVGIKYRVRVKRHHSDGRVASYPTQEALDFFDQGQLPGMELVRLIAGYEWDREQRSMGTPLLSLRDGMHDIVWIHPLPEVDEQGGTVVRPVMPGPTGPVIGLPGIDVRHDETSGDTP